MRGTFKKAIDRKNAEKLVAHLEEGGLAFETKWEFKSNSLPKDDPENRVTALTLTSDGKKFFRHRERTGTVIPKHIPKDKHSVLYEGFARAGLYTEPNFGPGLALAILHLIVYVVFILPKYMEVGGNFATFCTVFFIAMYIGLLLVYLGTLKKQSILITFGLCAYLPGLVMGAPVTMLTRVLYRNFFHGTLFNNVKPFLPEAEPQTLEVLQ